MDCLVQPGKYGYKNTTYPNTLGYFMVKCVSEAYTLQGDTKWDVKIITDIEIVVKV